MTSRISEFSLVQLAHGVSVFQRGPGLLQFGLDATRTGLIESEKAEELLLLIDACANPTPLHLLTSAVRHHVGADEARSIIADLVSFRILVPVTGPQVLMLGASPLAGAIAATLQRSGVAVRTPLSNDRASTFLALYDEDTVLAVVDLLPRSADIARLTRQRRGPVIPVAMVDSRVFVGPLRQPGTGACPHCAHLHLADRDVAFDDGLEFFPHGPVSPDPVVLAAGAAWASAFIRRVAGMPDPPGVSAKHPVAGQCDVVDPFGPNLVTSRFLFPHPRCGVCY